MIAQVSPRFLAAAALLTYPAHGHFMVQEPPSRSFDHSRYAGKNGNYFDDIDTVPYAYAAGGIKRIIERAAETSDNELNEYGGGSTDLFPLYYSAFAANGNYMEPNSIAVRHSICGGPRLGAPEDFKPYSTNSDKFDVLRTYGSGDSIEIGTVVAIWHAGHIEVSVCDTSDESLNPGGVPTQECFNKYPLTRDPSDDSSPIDPNYTGRYYVQPPCRAGETDQDHGLYDLDMPVDGYRMLMKYKLPEGLTCTHCVVQIHYFTGHVCKHVGYDEFEPQSWPGSCATSKSDWIKQDTIVDNVCGTQVHAYPEEFWQCSDIGIVSGGGPPLPEQEEEEEEEKAFEEEIKEEEEEAAPVEEEAAPVADSEEEPVPEEKNQEEDYETEYDFIFHGCVEDDQADRIMTRMELPDDVEEKMTGELCMDICAGYKYSGTQWAKECWCGGDDTDHLKHGESARCNSPCLGDEFETCGGWDCMEVREIV